MGCEELHPPVVAVMWTVDDALVLRAARLAEEQRSPLVLLLVVRRPWTLMFDAALGAEFDSMDLELEALLKAGALLADAPLVWSLHTAYGETSEAVATRVRQHRPGWIVLGRSRWRHASKVLGLRVFPPDTKVLIV